VAGVTDATDQYAAGQVDVVIVGSGPAGCTYARLICDQVPEARVLVVESGPVVSQPPGTHVNTIVDDRARARAKVASQGPVRYSYNIPPAGQELLTHRLGQDGPILPHEGLFLLSSTQEVSPDFPAAAMASNVGGMGAHWFGSCPRPAGTERIAFLEDPAPLDGPTLDDALSTAEGLLGVSARQFAGSPAAKWRENALGAVFDPGRAPDRRVQAMPLAVNRETPGSGQAGPAVVLGPLLNGAHGNFELRPETLCRRVVMSGDRATGVELVDLASGTPYQVAARQVVIAADSLRTPQLLFASGVRPAALGRRLNEHPYIAALFQVDETASQPGDPDALMPASGVTWIPFDDASFPLQVQVHQRAQLLSAGLFLRNEIRPENRVEFSDSARDWRDLPRMRIHYSLSDLDRAVVDQAMAVAADIGRACTATALDGWPQLMPGGSSLHYQGTVRMGAADDGDSVCDRHGRVWNTENLYVAGNGLIPTSTACNPTLTGVALATIGARRVSAELNSA
jgi:choline dehydrogenase-like flavoprotein